MRRRALLGGGLRLVDSEAYVFEIDTRNTAVGTTGANQFQLHIANFTSEAEANYWVDFGDGTVKRISGKSDPDLLHTYSNSGVYTIKVYKARRDSRYIVQADAGTAPKEFQNKLIKVMNYGFSEQENYYGCVNLTHIYALGQPLIYNNSFLNEYRDCHKLVHIQDIESWYVSNVTNMNSMFYNCYEFNSDLSSWDVSNVTNMNRMFSNCYEFNSDLSSWDVSNVTNMNSMFSNCYEFNSDLSSWNVSSVTNMQQMFSNCYEFNSDLSSWYVSNVTNMYRMFYNCYEFNSDLSSWNVSSVTNMQQMFSNCYEFNSDLSNWNVSNVTNMNSMFYNCYEFNSDLSSWDVSSVTSMSGMFRNCNVFNSDLSSWDVSSVTNFNLFMWSSSLPATLVIDFSQWTFNKDIYFGLFVQFMSGTRAFTAEKCDIFLEKLAESVIGKGRNPSISKNIGFYPIQCTAVGKVYYDALVADGWTFQYGITVV